MVAKSKPHPREGFLYQGWGGHQDNQWHLWRPKRVMVWYPLLDLPLSMGEKARYERQRHLLLTDGKGHPCGSVWIRLCALRYWRP